MPEAGSFPQTLRCQPAITRFVDDELLKRGLIDTYRSHLEQWRNVRRYRFLSGVLGARKGHAIRSLRCWRVRPRGTNRTSAAKSPECGTTRPRRRDDRSPGNEPCVRAENGRFARTWISAASSQRKAAGLVALDEWQCYERG